MWHTLWLGTAVLGDSGREVCVNPFNHFGKQPPVPDRQGGDGRALGLFVDLVKCHQPREVPFATHLPSKK